MDTKRRRKDYRLPFRRNAFALTVAASGFLTASAWAQTQTPPPNNGGLPYVSPDGTKISFVGYRGAPRPHLFIIGADGTGEKQLTTDGAGPGRWLPDGKHLVYTFGSGKQDTSSILVVGTDGSPSQSFARLPGRDPIISPDGKWVLMSIGTWTDGKLWITRHDGTDARQVTTGAGGDFNAAFSRDGKQIAFTRLVHAEGAPKSEVTVWVVNTDGTGQRKLSAFDAKDGGPQWPSWAPDGKTIAIQSGVYGPDRAANTAHIWLLDVASGKATKLAAHERAYLDETPAFFPDGRHIAFQSDRTGRMEIWVMNADGTGARQVTR